MAVTLDATSSVFTSAGSSTTLSHTTSGANRGLLVFVGIETALGAPTVSSVTYAGVSMTLVRSDAVASGSVRSEIWKLAAPASGANNIVVTLSAAADHAVAGQSYNNVHADVVSNHNGVALTTGNPSVAVTSAVGELVADITHSQRDNTDAQISPGAGQTQRWTQGAGDNRPRAKGSTEAGAASVTMSWSYAAATREKTLSAASVKEVVATDPVVMDQDMMF